MNILEEAVIYATVMHTGVTRKGSNTPYILHPLEVAQIVSTMTNDIEVITAAILHDIVEDTDGTLKEIRSRFGERVAKMVDSETEIRTAGEDKAATWKSRKEESLLRLKNADDPGIRILWFADKLSNLRSLSHGVTEKGSSFWNTFNQKDPQMHQWYYTSVAELVEMDLNRTGAFKEFLILMNELWPDTFAREKAKFKNYRQFSVEGLKVIGKGAKGTVYRYNDELVIKVYNQNNLYKDIERENYLARKALIAGIPTAISFGIVLVDDCYGSLFELIDSDCVSNLIAANPEKVEEYAGIMAGLALEIHHADTEKINLPNYKEEVDQWISGGLGYADPELAERIQQMVDALPEAKTLIHGDFHTGNVMKQGKEYLLIDMDRLSFCHPIVELCGLYMFYIAFGELDPSFIENYMGFSYDISKAFYRTFMIRYLNTKDEARLNEVQNKAALLAYVRLVRRCYDKGTNLSEKDMRTKDYYMQKIRRLLQTVDRLDF